MIYPTEVQAKAKVLRQPGSTYKPLPVG